MAMTSQAGYSYENIIYAVQKHDGSIAKAATQLTSNMVDAETVWDRDPQAAASPDGHVAVTWMRERMKIKDYTYNYNVMLAILDQDGIVIWGPAEVSQNTGWNQDYYNPGYQHFNVKDIAASDDNHFMLAWHQWNYTGKNYNSIDNLYTITYGSLGQQVQPKTNLTNNTSTSSYFSVPDLVALPGSRFMLLYEHQNYANNDDQGVYSMLFNSSGAVVRGQLGMSSGYSAWANSITATPLSNGNVLVAWHISDWSTRMFKLITQVLDANLNPTNIREVYSGPEINSLLSTADSSNHAVLIFSDASDVPHYILYDGNKDVFQPQIPLQDSWQNIDKLFLTSVTTYDMSLVNGADSYVASSAHSAAAPGGVGYIALNLGNQGNATAGGLTLMATIDPNLTLLDNLPGEMLSAGRVCIGSTCIWSLPDLYAMGTGEVHLRVKLPADSAVGTKYPVKFTLTSTNSDAQPVNNEITVNVTASKTMFLPLLKR